MSLVGSYVALSKPLAAAIPVFLLAWLRFGVGGLAMVHWLRKPAEEPPMTGQTKQLVFLESFLGNFLFSICMLFGVSMTSAVSAGVIMASIPAVVALMSWAFLRERIGLRIWGAVACAAAGIGLLSSGCAMMRPKDPAATAQRYLELMAGERPDAAYPLLGAAFVAHCDRTCFSRLAAGQREDARRALTDLRMRVGLRLAFAYGNASTDVCAYARSTVAPAATFIAGENVEACEGFAAPVSVPVDYVDHLRTLSVPPP